MYRKARRTFGKAIKNRRLPTGIVFPDVYRCKLVYHSLGQMAGSSGAVQLVFSGNDLFDPNWSGGGHQPMYYDQLCTLYTKWRVTGCKIILKGNAGSSALAYMWLGPAMLPTGPTTPTEAFEQPHYISWITTGNGASGRFKKTMSFSTKRMFGVKDISDDEYSGQVASSPVFQWYWVIGCQAVDNTNYNQWLDVKLIYYCQFEKRDMMGMSVETSAGHGDESTEIVTIPA